MNQSGYFRINGQKFSLDTLKENITARSLFVSDTNWAVDLYSFLDEWINEKSDITGKTSGSTGIPKLIRLSKKAMIESALRTNAFFHLQQDDRALLCLSANYIAGKMMIVRAIIGGLDLIVVPPASMPDWSGNIDFAAMVPMQVHSLLFSKEGRYKLSSVKNLIIGGSPLSGLVEKELLQFPVKCYCTYGMTETVSHVALSPIIKEENNKKVYYALPDVRFEQDERGCLVIYAAYITSKPFITNDIVELLSENAFSWLGRWDNMINSGSVKLFPEEIERKIADLIDSRFYITSIPHESLGQQVVLKIEGKPWNKERESLFMKQISCRLMKYEKPKQVFFQEKFEETNTGKVKRI